MSLSPKPRGVFIVFEGIDRAGKSTQLASLFKDLSKCGVPAFDTRFPNYDAPTGALLRSYIRGSGTAPTTKRATHLLFAANRAECMPLIEAALAQGMTVICDRYAYSGIAYSVGLGESLQYCQSVEADLPAPDAVIYFKLPVADAVKRAGFGGDCHDIEALQERIKETYERPDMSRAHQRWIEVDATLPVDSLALLVQAHVHNVIAFADRAPLRKLFVCELGCGCTPDKQVIAEEAK